MQRYNRHSVEVLTPATGVVLTPDQMQTYLALEHGQDTGMIEAFIATATDAMERYLRRSLLTQTLRLTLDGFQPGGDDNIVRLGPGVHTASVSYILGGCDFIDLPRGPVQSVTEVVTFDKADASAVFSSSLYGVDTAGERLFLNDGVVWPDNLRAYAAVRVDYVAGYSAIPPAILQGIRQHVATMYECRSACDMPDGSQKIAEGFRRVDGLGWE